MAETKSPELNRVLRFGVFQVNLAGRELRKHGVRIRLPGQPFCILSILLEKPGEVVSREEIRHRLWSSDTFVDFEHSLNSAHQEASHVAGRLSGKFTVHRDYPARWLSVRRSGGGYPRRTGNPLHSLDCRLETLGLLAQTKEPWPRRWAVSLAISAILIAAMGGYFVWSRTRVRPQPQSKVTTETRFHAQLADAHVKDSRIERLQ